MPPRRNTPPRLVEAMPPDLPDTRHPAILPDHDLDDEGTYRGLDYVELDQSGRVAESVELDGCRFTSSDLGGTTLDKSVFVNCVVENSNLANLRANSGSMRRVRMSMLRMTGFQWVNGGLRDVLFDDCRLDLSTFRFSKLTDVVFNRCNLTQVDFTNADLGRARFVDCVLAGAQFSHASMTGTRFTRCELIDVGGVTALRGAVVEGHNLIALAHTLATALGMTIEQSD
jgi:uncharacterized protein YjbI with pentapeptide repeats